jgi:hypothetical protein
MKKQKLSLNKKTIKNLKLKLKKVSNRKVAPLMMFDDPSNGSSC